MSGDLRTFVQRLEESGELVRVSEELSTQHEIAAAIKYVAQREGKAVLFERAKDYDVPIVANLLGSRERVAMAFDVKEHDLDETYLARAQNRIKPVVVTSAPVQEVMIESEIDIRRTLPVLTHHEKDAGPYMTSAITIAKDPETGVRGMGLHRIQVKDKDTIGIFLATPPLSHFLAKAEQQGKPLQIAVASGVAPLTFCAAIFFAPQGVDKFEIAGGFAQAPIELVRCRSVDIEAPADAEFILEGSIIPQQREKEGPFGESTGYYFTYDNPVAKIKAISHRANPIYHALLPFSGEERVLTSFMLGSYTLRQVQKALPQVRRMHIQLVGEIVIAQIDKKSDDDGAKVIDYLLSSPFAKIVVVTDGDVNISDLDEVAWAVGTRVHFDRDVTIRSDLPGLMIDPSTSGGEKTPDLSQLTTRTAKIGIDATKPLSELGKFERIDVPQGVKEKIWKILEKR
jgi:2,5-furandicarboxylate decarboxylase 1